ncbi:MAG: type ISP restriction/modification enzyme [Promethearchaeota archaeon]
MEIPEIIIVPPKSIGEYARKTSRNFYSGSATETTYYADFKQFLESIFPPGKGYLIQTGAKLPGSANKPDLTVSFNGITLFHIEAKLPFTPIQTMINQQPPTRVHDQVTRYLTEGTQVLLTDFVDIWLVKPEKAEKNLTKKTQKSSEGKMGENIQFQFKCTLLEKKSDNKLVPATNANHFFQELLTLTCSEHLQSISNAKKLIYPLADLAHNIREKTIFLLSSESHESSLSPQQIIASRYLLQIKEDFSRSIFKEEVDQELYMFADLFAQTIVYGTFSAWIKFCQKERNSGKKFAIHLVGDYLPFGSFLRDLFLNLKHKTPEEFQYIFQEMEKRFQNTEFSPIINNSETLITTFYSDFLSLYDPQTAKERGVVYTPYEIVRYMVEGIDFLLKRWMDKPQGIISSTLKKKISSKLATPIALSSMRQKSLTERPLHVPIDRLRFLDPAAGTMAFASGLLHVAKEKFHEKHSAHPSLAEGAFQKWVMEEFLENMYAFEILMAPYVLGHIRTFLTLQDLGLNLNSDAVSLKSYLMNTLMSPPEDKTLDEWVFHNKEIGNEIKEAIRVRDQKEIFVIMGNPPYNLSSQNNCKWINGKIDDYKKGLQERNKKILSDDYVKFLRFAQWKIEKVGKGIVAFITNSRYLEGQMFSVMRKTLKKTFDHIYIVNLHGDYRKKETGNPFDIKVGVSIAFMVRQDNSPNKNGAVHYMDVADPSKEAKYMRLAEGFKESSFKLLSPTPKDFFIDIDTTFLDRYQSFIPVDELFKARPLSGIMAGKDHLVVDTEVSNLHQNMEAFFSKDFAQLEAWKIRTNDTKSWQKAKVYSKTNSKSAISSIRPMLYRGWDYRYIVYDRAILEGHRMGYIDLISETNPALTVTKSSRKNHFCTAFVSDQLIEKCYMSVTDTAYAFLFQLNGKSNLIIPPLPYSVTNKDLFHYIYAILQCPAYRARYDELLRKGFPRIPFPTQSQMFQELAAIGQTLTNLHLLKVKIDPRLETADVLPNQWKVGQFNYADDENCLYFDTFSKSPSHLPWIKGISKEMWEFSVGGIAQLQQFLASRRFSKVRKRKTLQRALDYDELNYFLRMISAIKETIGIYPNLNEIYEKLDVVN